MYVNLLSWLKLHLKKVFNSIAFYPALIALFFLFLSYLMINIDYSALGKEIKAQAEWLKLKDASTARTIISVVASGILSLTVFSFTMVMVILNQAASQMSNRVLDWLIGNRYQQVILGFYIGTIVYSLFLLTAIRDIDSGIYVPSLSTYLLIALAVIDIFFFIYFLHFITQSVRYAVIIRRIHHQTAKKLEEHCCLSEDHPPDITNNGKPLLSPVTGIFEGCNRAALLRLAKEENFVLSFLYPQGTFVLCDTPVAVVHAISQEKAGALLDRMKANLYVNEDQSVSANFYYGFRQLTEVALRALSPGINDPGTAVESLRAITDLLAYRLLHFPDTTIKDEDGIVRILTRELSFKEIFDFTVLPIWDYGKNDRFIQNEMQHLLLQLQSIKTHPSISKLLLQVDRQIAKREE